jgi:hypothetical protein
MYTLVLAIIGHSLLASALIKEFNWIVINSPLEIDSLSDTASSKHSLINIYKFHCHHPHPVIKSGYWLGLQEGVQVVFMLCGILEFVLEVLFQSADALTPVLSE